MGIGTRKTRPQSLGSRLIVFYFFAAAFFAPLEAFCADADTQQVMELAAQKAAKEATEKVVEKAAEKAAEKAVQKAAEMAAGQTTAEVVEKAAKRAIDQAAGDTAAKEQLKAERPDEWRGPTKVHFAVFVLDIDAIDDANQSFMTNVYLRLRWQDRRLASPNGKDRQIPLEDVWNPQVILANRQGLVSRSLPEVVQIEPDGWVTYRQRYSGMLSQPLQLANFPMDRHMFNVQFTSAAYGAEQLELVPDAAKQATLSGGAMASELSVPDWKILGYEALALPYRPIEQISMAGFVFRFEAERYVGYYFWQVVLPLSVVVIMSWAGFWVQRGQVGVRIGIATSAILTLIAQRFVLASLLPRLPYMTRMDYFTVGCTLLVFMALIGVVTTSYLGSINRDIMAQHLDHWARGLFPATFLLLFGWFSTG